MKFLTIALISLSFSLQANDMVAEALSYVPGGQVVRVEHDEVKIQTSNGTIVEIEFLRNGSFEEASGKNAQQDVLTPPNSLVTLGVALQGLKDAGKSASGEWSLEHSMRHNWHYEFEGYENGQEMEYVVNAKTGKFIAGYVD
jgi:hypothetical protein